MAHLLGPSTHDSPNVSSSSHWHTIRPWTSRLSLSVREITSVSASFVLTSGMDSPDSSIDLAALGLGESEIYDDSPGSDLLGRELAVKVNGTSWQNVLVDVNEEGEEAIIVLYGLMPGRHYEVELNIISGKEIIRKHVVTDADSTEGSPISEHGPDIPGAISGENSSPSSISIPIPSTPSQPPPPPRMITVEERASQLRHNLSLLTTEKESLLSQLKNARRDTQKTEASLKSEMDALKRASEKQSATEHRSRQKVLALQEAVKQALAAATDAEDQAEKVLLSVPKLVLEAEEVEKEHARIEEEAARSEADTEEAIVADKKLVADIHNELAALTHRLERLNGKKERLESETLPETEADLRILQTEYAELQREEDAEVELYGHLGLSSEAPQKSGLFVPHAMQVSSPSIMTRLAPIGRPALPFGDSIPPRPMRGTSSRPGLIEIPVRQSSLPSPSNRTQVIHHRASSEALV